MPAPLVIQLSPREHEAFQRYMETAPGITRAQAARELIMAGLVGRPSRVQATGPGEAARAGALGGLAESIRRFLKDDGSATAPDLGARRPGGE
jgi:hypothetical protein